MLAIPAIFLLTAAPAHACMQGMFELLLTGLMVAAAALMMTAMGQAGLMRLRRKHTLSWLGKWTLGGLSTLHLFLGLGILFVGLSGGPSGLVFSFLLALPLLLLSRGGYIAFK